jgi:hypothetical protein
MRVMGDLTTFIGSVLGRLTVATLHFKLEVSGMGLSFIDGQIRMSLVS